MCSLGLVVTSMCLKKSLIIIIAHLCRTVSLQCQTDSQKMYETKKTCTKNWLKTNSNYSFLNLPHFLGTSEYSDSFYIALELTIFVDSLTRPSIVLMDFPNTFSPFSLHISCLSVFTSKALTGILPMRSTTPLPTF